MPEQFGRYELLKRLAGGGMGEVYLARQRGPAGFQKLLVIKMLLPHLCEDEEFLAMFKDEARLCAHLVHPNICQVFEFDRAADTWYIAMEYLRGEDLRKLWRACAQQERPLPVPLVCRIVADAAAGLAFAHALRDPAGRPYGIVHRDISPQNILVTLDGGVKIIDFGIAKAAGRAQHTRTGALKGKCGYMSPEQADGASIDGRADIFALGVVFHELLTGRRLFKDEDDVRTLARVRECRVPRPSELVPELPPGLDLIVLTALAKDPDGRYATAQEMRLAIEDWLIEGRRSASSAHLAEFLKVVYADRLEREAGEATAELSTPAATRTPGGSLRSGAGQSAVRTETGARRSTARRATVAATAAAALAAVSLVAFLSRRAPAPPPPAAVPSAALTPVPSESPAPAPKVMVVLKTDPAGAEIAEGSTVIGTSPHVWSATRGEHQLRFQLAGHRGVTQEIVAAADGQEILVRLPPVRAAHRVVKDPAIKAER